MRWFALICVWLFPAVHAIGQHRDASPWMAGLDQPSTVGIRAQGAMVSDGLNNRFLRSLAFSEMLSDEVRLSQLEKLGTENRAGMYYSLEIGANLALNKSSLSMVVNLADEMHGGFNFTSDAARFILQGNMLYKGSSLDFSGSEGHFIRFQKFGCGLAWKPDVSANFGILVSAVVGESMAQFDIDRAEFYTSTRADTLVLDIVGSMTMSDTASPLGWARGGGIAADLFMSERFNALGSVWNAALSVHNLGMVQWHPGALALEHDTIHEFAGVDVTELVLESGDFSSAQSTDSIAAGYLNKIDRGALNTVLPGWIQIGVRQQVKKGIETGLGISYRWRSQARAYIWLESGFRFGERLFLGVELGHGGHGTLQTGISGRFTSGSIDFRMRIANAEAWLFPGNFGGLSCSAGINMKL